MAAYVAPNGTRHPGGRLHWGGLKSFVDGSLGTRTALLHEPYSDAPGYRGLRAIDPARLAAELAGAHANGLPARILCRSESPSRCCRSARHTWQTLYREESVNLQPSCHAPVCLSKGCLRKAAPSFLRVGSFTLPRCRSCLHAQSLHDRNWPTWLTGRPSAAGCTACHW